jgi:hypothetical protein
LTCHAIFIGSLNLRASPSILADGKVSEITVEHPNFEKRLTPTPVP